MMHPPECIDPPARAGTPPEGGISNALFHGFFLRIAFGKVFKKETA